jgi:hypothetical protein
MKKTKLGFLATVVLVTVASLFTVCKATGVGSGGDISGGGNVSGQTVTWTIDASQRADDGTATLNMGFGPVVTGLGAGDFTFEGAAITADTLTGGGASPKLSVKDVPGAGIVKVSVRKAGYDFNPAAYNWDIATGSTVAASDDDATLLSLFVTYTGKTGNLVGGFTPEEYNYSFNAANGETAATLTVTAASSKASLDITYGDAGVAGQSITNGSNITLPVIGNKTLSVTVTAENSDTQTYTVTINAYIAQDAPPPVSAEDDDYTLQLLSVSYSGQTENKVAEFVASNTNYSFNVEQGHETAVVYAAASSSHSGLDIKYGASNADAPQDISVVNDGVITLPVAGSKVLKIKVTARNGNAQTYYITINAYVAVTKTYSGTIAYSGGTKTITGVAGRDAAFVTQSASGATTWTLTVPNSYTPESFVVTLSDGAYSYRSKALYPATISTTSPITLTLADPDDIGRQVASAIDLADFANAPTVNYSLADNITLPDDWGGGPNNYSGRFYGNGYTIKNLTFASPISGSKGLFNSFGAGAQVHDLNLEVTPSATPLAVNGALYLGALIGSSTNPGLLVKGVHVTGGFNIGTVKAGVAVYLGGIIATVGADADFTMENCSTDMDIVLNAGSSSIITTAVGGLVGNIAANVTAVNCYTAGSITATATLKDGNWMYVGGLVARNYVSGASGFITLDKCYSSMTIEGTRGDTPVNAIQVGGLFAYIGTTTHTLSNVVALNQSILGAHANDCTLSRIAGNITSPSNISNAYAREDMAVSINGNTSPALSTGSDAKDGESTSLADLRKKPFWTGLGFDEAVWDFTPLSASTPGWPVLR